MSNEKLLATILILSGLAVTIIFGARLACAMWGVCGL